MKAIILLTALLTVTAQAQPLDWQKSGYKQYSTDLYTKSERQSAHWLARDFTTRRNCNQNKQFASFDDCYLFIMALHYSNDVR